MEIYFDYNGIKAISPSFMVNMERLNIIGNEIAYLDGTSFYGITKLKTVLINNNKIDSIKRVTLSKLINLEYFDLAKIA